ncbi:MAG: hypothetical protein NZL89_02205 [Leptospiraceae bacterium]|nr:hypothetical protein [Leptospiraceae bacterium]
MDFLRRDWPLFLSALFFLGLMVLDYSTGFMADYTPLTSGRNSELFVSAGVVTVLTLALLEGILGLDNATVLAMQVRHLGTEDAHRALTWGVWGAFFFRFIFLLLAGIILEQKWVMALGAYYLVNMAGEFFLNRYQLLLADLTVLGLLGTIFFLSGNQVTFYGIAIPTWWSFAALVAYALYSFAVRQSKNKSAKNPSENRIRSRRYPLLAAIISVEWTDILFSFDSIGAGIALTRDFWVLFWGAFFGVTSLRLFAKLFIQLLKNYPQLESAAMLAVLVVGIKLGLEAVQAVLHVRLWHVANWQTSLLIIVFFGVAFWRGKSSHKKKTPHAR